MQRRLPRKTSEEQKQLMRSLYEQGDLSIREIARRTDASYGTVYCNTRALEIGFASPIAYKKQSIENKGYARWIDSHKDSAKSKGADSMKQRKEQIAKEAGFSSRKAYEEYLARQNGYKSISERKKAVIGRKMKKPENQTVGRFIKERLEEIGETQSWLALQIGTSKDSISKYSLGINIPSEERLERIFSTLQTPYKTIDDLMQDRNSRRAI